jgi:hypothetical protein
MKNAFPENTNDKHKTISLNPLSFNSLRNSSSISQIANLTDKASFKWPVKPSTALSSASKELQTFDSPKKNLIYFLNFKQKNFNQKKKKKSKKSKKKKKKKTKN